MGLFAWVLGSSLFGEIPVMAQVGFATFFFFAAKYFVELGEKIEIRDIMILLALLQWIVGPILAYTYFPDDPIFYMSVDIETYMAYVVPATFAFIAGLYLPIFRKYVHEDYLLHYVKILGQRYRNIDFLLIVVGLVAYELVDFVPGVLRFVMVLFSSMRFVGLYFLILNDRPFKWLIFAVVLGLFAAAALRTAMFHDLLLWLGFIFTMVAFIYKFSVRTKLLLMVGFFFLGVSVQAVKYSLRTFSASNRGLDVLGQVAGEKVEGDYLLSEVYLSSTVVRMNQGWIISRILAHMPTFEPFAEGETIRTGIMDALLPSIIREKTTFAGYSIYFERFTGLRLAKGTSMDLSVLGEAYANYGNQGGAVFMFLYGLFFNFLFMRVFLLAIRHPSLILWIPLIFLHTVKAETDFASTMNYLFKAIIVVWAFFFGMKRFLNINI